MLIGRQFFFAVLSTDLKIGVISACFNSLGHTTFCMQELSMSVNIGALISTLSFSRPMFTPIDDFLLSS